MKKMTKYPDQSWYSRNSEVFQDTLSSKTIPEFEDN